MDVMDANDEKGIKIYNPTFDSGYEDADTGSLPMENIDLIRPVTEPADTEWMPHDG